ncbi:MAG: (2Fe-2S)-binding protein [Burkholderiales bacterium]
MSAARMLGKPVAASALAAAVRERTRHRAFADLVSDVFALKRRVLDRVTDETLACRCEEVTAGAVRAAARAWGANVNYVKGVTRCGMGYCQGRVCGSLVEDITADALGLPPGSVDSFRVRAPLKPVTVRDLAAAAK